MVIPQAFLWARLRLGRPSYFWKNPKLHLASSSCSSNHALQLQRGNWWLFLSGKFGEDVSKGWFKTTVKSSRSGESSDIEKSELVESKEPKGRYMGMIWKAGSNGKSCCSETPCWRLVLLPQTKTECKEHGLCGAWSWQMLATPTKHLKQRISTQWQLFLGIIIIMWGCGIMGKVSDKASW